MYMNRMLLVALALTMLCGSVSAETGETCTTMNGPGVTAVITGVKACSAAVPVNLSATNPRACIRVIQTVEGDRYGYSDFEVAESELLNDFVGFPTAHPCTVYRLTGCVIDLGLAKRAPASPDRPVVRGTIYINPDGLACESASTN
jgi:hypothetical protein